MLIRVTYASIILLVLAALTVVAPEIIALFLIGFTVGRLLRAFYRWIFGRIFRVGPL